MPEVLVILNQTGAGRDAVVGKGSVSHEVSERVFVLSGDTNLRGVPGVERVYTGGESADDLPEGLSPAESVFVKGWMQRAKKAEPRPGEGKDWDAPGFLPPDSPPGRR